MHANISRHTVTIMSKKYFGGALSFDYYMFILKTQLKYCNAYTCLKFLHLSKGGKFLGNVIYAWYHKR